MQLSKALSKRLTRFHNRLGRLLDDASTKNVHEFRVACRELLACYPLLEVLTPGKGVKPIVKQALRSLNNLRDLQQMQQQLLAAEVLPPTQLTQTFEETLHKARTCWQEFAPELQAPEFNTAITAMEEALQSPCPHSAALQTAWEHQWEKSLRQVRKHLLAADPNDLDGLHSLRIRYKKLRYLLELRLQTTPPNKKQQKALKDWQETLGTIGDLRVMARYAKELGLPKNLRQEYRRHAAQQARRFMRKRAAFAAFINELDQQLER